MADLNAPLRSLRDSLHALLSRTGDDYARANRVARTLLKVNMLLEAMPTGPDATIEALRSITEDIATCDPRDHAGFDRRMGQLEALLATL